jgi:hypothetical protein
MTRLSKSRIMSSLQCARRAHLEVHQPGLAKITASMEAAFATGHQVGDLAVRLYGDEEGTYVDYAGGGFSRQLSQTAELMTSMFRAPIFEATLRHDGVLVREDVLLPVDDKGPSWRIVEVKASTKLKPEHVHDCAIQTWVHRQSGHPLSAVALAHVDREFVYGGDGDYRGLLVEQDLTEAVFELQPSVPAWIEKARAAIAGPLPEVPLGQHCSNPYPCPFLDFCWPTTDEGGVDYPIMGLGGGRKQLGLWVMDGFRDIRDVPSAMIDSETRLRIHRVTCEGKAELLPGARAFVRDLPYPRFYLDFETVGSAVPLWAGTRPYQALPFQWSCHIERAGAAMEHEEFLDLSGGPPMRPLALELIRALESQGPVLMYTGFERGVINALAGLFPDLAPALHGIVERLVDLHPVTRDNYYHPDMLGSWSIKAVLPTIAPDLDYARLEGIKEGSGASSAYLEAIDPATSADRREEIRRELLRYCKHDTEAMVRLVRFFEAG